MMKKFCKTFNQINEMKKICLFFILSAALLFTACEQGITPDFSDRILTDEPVENGLYAYRCPRTGALSDILVAKDYNNAGDNLEITKNADGTYSAEPIVINLSKGEYLKLPVKVRVYLTYTGIEIKEPAYFKTATKLPSTDVDMDVSEAQYATFIAPFDAELPAGVTAYTVDGIDEDNQLILTETSIVANVPVILFSETPVSETLSGVSLAEAATYTEGLLTGVYAPVEISDGYVLQNLDGKIKFYRVTSDYPVTVPANKAYLTVD